MSLSRKKKRKQTERSTREGNCACAASALETRWAVFASGGGSLLRALRDSIRSGQVPGKLAAIVTDKPYCTAATEASSDGIPVLVYPHEGIQASELAKQLQNSIGASFLVLAGYTKRVPDEVLHAFPYKAVNAHPALLPCFGGKGYYGKHVHRAVLDSGSKLSGSSIHFVSSAYDDGPIIAQRPVPVLPSDDERSLAARVGEQERELLPAVCAALADGAISVAKAERCSKQEKDPPSSGTRSIVSVDVNPEHALSLHSSAQAFEECISTSLGLS